MTSDEAGWTHDVIEEHPRLARTARLLLILSAVLAIYFGLSSLLLPIFGEPNLYQGIARWTGPALGGLQLLAAAAAIRLVVRRNLAGAILAVAVCLLLGWADLLPPIITKGLDFRGEVRLTSASVVALPVIVVLALAWRRTRPLLAAFIVTLPIAFGFLISIALAISIAMRGF